MTRTRISINAIIILFLGLLVAAGSYAFFMWSSSENKQVSFNTAKELSEYIVYDEGNSQFVGEFIASNSYTGGIHSTIGISKTAAAANVNLVATINLDINSIGANMRQSTAVKWVVTSGTSSNIGTVLARGNFIGTTDGDTLTLVPNLPVTTTVENYTIWLWIDTSENPSDALIGETLDTFVWTQFDQIEAVESVYEITKINANYQVISATVVNNEHKITHYAVTATTGTPSSWTSIPAAEQSNVYNLVDSTTATAVGTYYVWFKDEEGNTVSEEVTVSSVDNSSPTCIFGSWNPVSIGNNETSSIELICTATASAITNSNLTTSDLTKSNNNINLTSITKSAINNGYKYTIVVTGTSTNGQTTITLPANKIMNAMQLGNAAATSGSVNVANVYTVTYQTGDNNCTLNPTTYAEYTATYGTAFSIANPSCSGYTFAGWTSSNLGVNATSGTTSNNQTSWNGTATTNTYFNNLTEGNSVTLTATWTVNTVTVNLNSDNETWSSTGMKVDLYQSGSSVFNTETSGSSSVTFSAVPNGTYDLYASYNSGSPTGITMMRDTGIDVVVNNGSVTKTIDYYTVTRSVGANTTLTTRYETSSGSVWTTTSVNFLKNMTLYMTASADTGYTVTLSVCGTTQTSSYTLTINSECTISSAATANQYYAVYEGTGGLVPDGSWEFDAFYNNINAHSTSVTSWNGMYERQLLNGTINDATWGADYLQFNGTSSSVDLGYTVAARSTMTLASTFMLDAVPSSMVYLMTNIESGGVALYINSSSMPGFEIYDTDTSTYVTCTSSTAISTGVKYHLEATYDGSTFLVYLNGTQVCSKSSAITVGAAPSTVHMYLGCNPGASGCTNGYFNGKIYNAVYYTSVRSAANVVLDSGKTVTYGSTYGTLASPVRAGYTFNGWYSDTGLTTQKTSSSTVSTTSDHTLYAKWTANTYAIQYDLDGGTAGSYAPSSGTFGSVVRISNPTKTGYTFAGWTSSDINTTHSLLGTSSTNFTSVWSNGSTPKTNEYFKNLTPESGGTVHLVANWTANQYYASYAGYGATNNSSSLVSKYDAYFNTLSNTHSTTTTTWYDWQESHNGTITGGTWSTDYLSFNGTSTWVNLGAINNTAYTIEAVVSLNAIQSGEVILVANYESGGYGISIRDGKPAAQFYDSNTSAWKIATASSALTAGTKYHIAGTYDGTTLKTYVNGTLVGSVSITGTIKTTTNSTVMAIGTNPSGTNAGGAYINAKIYSVAIYSAALSASQIANDAGKTITYASTYGTLPTPYRRGYTFDGWYTAASGGTQVISSSIVGTASNRTLYAHWTVKTLTVTFNCNDGSAVSGVTNPVTYTYGVSGQKFPDPAACTRTGYTGSKWTWEASGTLTGNYSWTSGVGNNWIHSNSTGNSSKILYAQWTANTYTITFKQGNATSTAGFSNLGTQTCTYNSTCVLRPYAGTDNDGLNAIFPYSSADHNANSNHTNWEWSFYGWGTSETATSRSYADNASFTYTTVGNRTLYAIGRKTFYFSDVNATDSNGPPVKIGNTLYQYWNPKTLTATLTTIAVPSRSSQSSNMTSTYGWSFCGFKGGTNTASADNCNNPTFTAAQAGTTVTPPYNVYGYNRAMYSRSVALKYNGNGNTGGSMTNSTTTQYYNSKTASNSANTTGAITTPSFTLKSNGFTKTNYNFNKWAAGSTSGTQYAAGATFNAWTPAFNTATTTYNMYATWTLASQTITLTNKNYYQATTPRYNSDGTIAHSGVPEWVGMASGYNNSFGGYWQFTTNAAYTKAVFTINFKKYGSSSRTIYYGIKGTSGYSYPTEYNNRSSLSYFTIPSGSNGTDTSYTLTLTNQSLAANTTYYFELIGPTAGDYVYMSNITISVVLSPS